MRSLPRIVSLTTIDCYAGPADSWHLPPANGQNSIPSQYLRLSINDEFIIDHSLALLKASPVHGTIFPSSTIASSSLPFLLV